MQNCVQKICAVPRDLLNNPQIFASMPRPEQTISRNDSQESLTNDPPLSFAASLSKCSPKVPIESYVSDMSYWESDRFESGKIPEDEPPPSVR